MWYAGKRPKCVLKCPSMTEAQVQQDLEQLSIAILRTEVLSRRSYEIAKGVQMQQTVAKAATLCKSSKLCAKKGNHACRSNRASKQLC
jgi:hypothetical protein